MLINDDVIIAQFDAMFRTQFRLETVVFGNDLPDMPPAERNAYVDWNILAVEDELHEALAECGWKPWASSRHLNTERFHGELVDVWHFLMNLGLAHGLSDYKAMQEAISRYNLRVGQQRPMVTVYDDESRAAAIRYEVLNIMECLHRLRRNLHPYLYTVNWGGAILHFIILSDIVNLNAGRLYGLYTVKAARNEARQAEGYDGISGKCRQCHRDLKEAPPGDTREVGFCGLCRPPLDDDPGRVTSITHRAPEGDQSTCPCCLVSPFDLPASARLTIDPALVTCDGSEMPV